MRELSVVLGNYNQSAEAAMSPLDRAAGYRPFVATMPESSETSVPPLSTYEPRISVPIGSLLWGISGRSTQAAGFTVQITDVATKKPLFSQPISFDNASGQGSIAIKNCYGQTQNLGNPLHLLPKPLPILPPSGLLAVKIQNLANVANVLQICLHFALPTRNAAIWPNQYNDLITRELQLAMRAVRDVGANSLTTGGDGSTYSQTGNPQDSSLVSVPFDIASVGDNTIVAGNSGGRITIYQFDMWNVAQQDIALKDGGSLLRGIFAQFPGQTGWGLAPGSKWHFQLTPGQPLVINLSAGTQLTGFVRYRME